MVKHWNSLPQKAVETNLLIAFRTVLQNAQISLYILPLFILNQAFNINVFVINKSHYFFCFLITMEINIPQICNQRDDHFMGKQSMALLTNTDFNIFLEANKNRAQTSYFEEIRTFQLYQKSHNGKESFLSAGSDKQAILNESPKDEQPLINMGKAQC